MKRLMSRHMICRISSHLTLNIRMADRVTMTHIAATPARIKIIMTKIITARITRILAMVSRGMMNLIMPMDAKTPALIAGVSADILS